MAFTVDRSLVNGTGSGSGASPRTTSSPPASDPTVRRLEPISPSTGRTDTAGRWVDNFPSAATSQPVSSVRDPPVNLCPTTVNLPGPTRSLTRKLAVARRARAPTTPPQPPWQLLCSLKPCPLWALAQCSNLPTVGDPCPYLHRLPSPNVLLIHNPQGSRSSRPARRRRTPFFFARPPRCFRRPPRNRRERPSV